MERIGDYNSVYADGTNDVISTANQRYKEGQVAARELIRKIKDGEIPFDTENETIKIVTHSQGTAYGAGMASVLLEAKFEVKVLYAIAPTT